MGHSSRGASPMLPATGRASQQPPALTRLGASLKQRPPGPHRERTDFGVTIWVDVEDFFHYFAVSPRPSGIQRFAFEVMRALVDGSGLGTRPLPPPPAARHAARGALGRGRGAVPQPTLGGARRRAVPARPPPAGAAVDPGLAAGPPRSPVPRRRAAAACRAALGRAAAPPRRVPAAGRAGAAPAGRPLARAGLRLGGARRRADASAAQAAARGSCGSAHPRPDPGAPPRLGGP